MKSPKPFSFSSGSQVIPASASKATCKKFQSQMKSAVQSFGKLMFAWNNDLSQILVLVSELLSVCTTGESIYSELFLSKYNSLSKFDNLGPKLISNVHIEVESLLSQLRLFQKRLGDVVVAMSLESKETMSLVINESATIIEDDAIFTAEHCLEIQSLHHNYTREYRRKCALLDKFFSSTSSNNDHNVLNLSPITLNDGENLTKLLETTTENERKEEFFMWNKLNKSGLMNCGSGLGDDFVGSYVQMSLVEGFLLKNNITQER